MASKSSSEAKNGVDFARVYLLGTRHQPRALHVRPLTDVGDPFTLLRGESRPTGVPRFARVAGSEHTDLVGTTLPPLILVSNRLSAILERENLTGWKAVPAVVEIEDALDDHAYSLLVVTGKSGRIDDSLSQRAILPPPAGGKASDGWRGLFFPPASWDRSDFFVPESTGYICISDRARTAISQARATNCRFEPLNRVQRLML